MNLHSAVVPSTGLSCSLKKNLKGQSSPAKKELRSFKFPHLNRSYGLPTSKSRTALTPSNLRDFRSPCNIQEGRRKDNFNDLQSYKHQSNETSRNDYVSVKQYPSTFKTRHALQCQDVSRDSVDEIDDLIKSIRLVNSILNAPKTDIAKRSSANLTAIKKNSGISKVTKRIRRLFSKFARINRPKTSVKDDAHKKNCSNTKSWTCEQKLADNTIIPVPLSATDEPDKPLPKSKKEPEFNNSLDSDKSPDEKVTNDGSSEQCHNVKNVDETTCSAEVSSSENHTLDDDNGHIFPTLNVMITELTEEPIVSKNWLSTSHVDYFLHLLNTIGNPKFPFCHVLSTYASTEAVRNVFDSKPCKKFVSKFDENTRYCFIPITDKTHWTVFVLDIKQWTLTHYNPNEKDNRENMHPFIFRYVRHVFNKTVNPSIMNQKLPNGLIQYDNYNCGVYICHYMERIVFHGQNKWNVMPRCVIADERYRMQNMFNLIVAKKTLPFEWTPAPRLMMLRMHHLHSPPIMIRYQTMITLNSDTSHSSDKNYKHNFEKKLSTKCESSDTSLQQQPITASTDVRSQRQLELESQGHVYGYEKTFREYALYLPIFDEAVCDPSIFFGVDTIQKPIGGTIVIYNLDDVKKELFSPGDSLRDVRLNTHFDGWSWSKSNGKRPMSSAVRNMFECKTENKKSSNAFMRMEIFSLTHNMVLYHYVGNEAVASVDQMHGNARHKTTRYNRTEKSTKAEILERSKLGQKPSTIYNELCSKTVPSYLASTKKPRDLKQVQNYVQRAKYVSSNTAFVLMMMSGNLTWDHPDEVIKVRRFITSLNIALGDVNMHLINAKAFDEIKDIQKQSSEPIVLYYDTTFEVTDAYVSTLSFMHPYFNKSVALAHMIHETKSHKNHVAFIKALLDQFKCLTQGDFVFVTDDEFELDRVWPNAVHLLCFNHIRRACRRNMLHHHATQDETTEVIRDAEHLQKLKSFERFDQDYSALFDKPLYKQSKLANKVMKRIGPKIREKACVAALRRAELPLQMYTTNPAESLNAMLQRLKGSSLVRLDNMVLLLYYHGVRQFEEILKGYFQSGGTFMLQPRYTNQAKGDRNSTLPWKPECPAGSMTEMFDYVINNDQLWEREVDDAYEESVRRWRGEDTGSRTMDIMATTTGRVRQVSKNEYIVTSQNGDCNVVLLLCSANKTKCSCKSTRTCVHVRAVMYHLKAEVREEGNGDFVSEVKKTRANRKKSGTKKPRPGDYEKNDPKGIFEKAFSSDDDQVVVPPEFTQSERLTLPDAADINLIEGELEYDVKKASSDETSSATSPEASQSEEVVMTSMPSPASAAKDDLEIPAADNNVVDDSDNSPNVILNRVKLDAWSESAKPEIIDQDMPQWAQAFLKAMGFRGKSGLALISSSIYCPDFHNLLPVLKPNSIMMAKTTRNNIYIVVRCLKKDAASVKAYVLTNDQLPDTEVAEVKFHASHCCRDLTKVIVRVFNIPEQPVNSVEKWLLLVTKVQQLLASSDPARNKVTLTTTANHVETKHKLDIGDYRKMEATNKLVQASSYKQSTVHLYCCCRRAYIENASVERRNDLKMDYMTCCTKCKQWIFNHCANVFTEEAKKLQAWRCFDCVIRPPLLPKWGGGKFINTCPLDNFLAMCMMQCLRRKAFLNAISSANDPNKFRYNLLTFLNSDCTTEAKLCKAKKKFLESVYSSKDDLYGTEEELVLSHFKEDYSIDATLTCLNNACNERKEFCIDTLIYRYDLQANTLEDTVTLRNLQLTLKPCICGGMWETAFKYKHVPWVVPVLIQAATLSAHFFTTLPRMIEINGKSYHLAGISFSKTGHFTALVPVMGGYIAYDGMAQRNNVQSFRNAVKELVSSGGKPHRLFYMIEQ